MFSDGEADNDPEMDQNPSASTVVKPIPEQRFPTENKGTFAKVLVTTSIVESQNSATKGNHSYSVKCQMTLDLSLETLTLFGRNYIDRKMQQSAKQ